MTHGRLLEAVHQPPRRLGVVEVEVRQLLAAVLHGVVPPAAGAGDPVAGALLVRVLAVAQVLHPLQLHGHPRGQRGRAVATHLAGGVALDLARHPADDRRVVGRGVGERLRARRRRVAAESAPACRSSSSTGPYCAGSTTTPTWAWFLAAARTMVGPPTSISSMPGCVGERVEVGDQEGDRLDAELGQVGAVLRLVEVGQQPGVHRRVQRHDAVAEDGREAGELGDVGDGQPGPGDRRRGAAARDEAPTEVVQPGGQLDHAGLVVDGEQGGRHASTSSMTWG